MIRAVLFDLDDTLIDHRGAQEDALRAWLGERFGPSTQALWDTVAERHLRDWRARTITYGEQRRRRLRDFLPAVGIAYAEPELDEIFAGYLREYSAVWRAFPDSAPALSDLSAAGIGLAVLTNGTAVQQAKKLDRTGLSRYFGHRVFTPDDLGVAKPDPAAFRLVCAKWGMRPDEVLSIGDRHELDVLPARRAGLRAAHLDRHDAGPHDETARLSALSGLMGAFPLWFPRPESDGRQ